MPTPTLDNVCIVYNLNSTPISIGAVQNLEWTSSAYDPSGMHSIFTDTDKINILETGIYEVKLSFLAGVSGGTVSDIFITTIHNLQGGGANYIIARTATYLQGLVSNVHVSRLLQCSAGDTIYCEIDNSYSSASFNVYAYDALGPNALDSPYLSVVRISN